MSEKQTAFRSMRRLKQQLTHEECVELLKKEPRGVLSVLGENGYPYGFPMDFVYDEGKLYFHCAKEGHKIDAIQACDKVSFSVIDEGVRKGDDWPLHFKSVILFGRMRILEDREEIISKVRLLGLKYFPDAESVEEELKRSGSRVACLELTIDHMTGKRIKES